LPAETFVLDHCENRYTRAHVMQWDDMKCDTCTPRTRSVEPLGRFWRGDRPSRLSQCPDYNAMLTPTEKDVNRSPKVQALNLTWPLILSAHAKLEAPERVILIRHVGLLLRPESEPDHAPPSEKCSNSIRCFLGVHWLSCTLSSAANESHRCCDTTSSVSLTSDTLFVGSGPSRGAPSRRDPLA